MKKKMIITADDYGMCNSVNEGIEDCLEAGALQTTCVMTNMPYCEAIVSLRNRFPGISIGLHWNVTIGKPLLSPREVPSLVDSEGMFHSLLQFKHRWFTGKIQVPELRTELYAQFQFFREMIGLPDFWNTHQNIHMTPGLFGLFVVAGKSSGIRAMRCHRRITVPNPRTERYYSLCHPLFWFKGKIISNWSSWAENQKVIMPDGIVHLPGFELGKAAIEEGVAYMQSLSIRKAVELVIHPATSVDSRFFGKLTKSRLQEHKTFSDPGLKHRLYEQGFETVGFEVLNHG